MVHRTANDYLCDETYDLGDSAMRAGVLALFAGSPEPLEEYVTEHGWIMRGPAGVMARNHLNTSRDQMIPFMAGLWAQNKRDLARKIFWAQMKRLIFGQNLQRDYPNSWKMPFPHWVTEDGKKYEIRYFDGPDILDPGHLIFFGLCARLWFARGLFLIGLSWHLVSLYFHSKSSHREHNQAACMSVVYGTQAIRCFKKWIPKYQEEIEAYWKSRNEEEYAKYIIDYLNKYV